MGRKNDDNEEKAWFMSEEAARRLVEWVMNHGHTKAEAYEALAVTMGAAVDKED